MSTNRRRTVPTPLNYMWRKRVLIQEDTDKFLNGLDLSKTTTDIYFYIAAHKANITNIFIHPYFKNVSISTIKRSILELRQKNLINVFTDNDDKRIKWFNINKE